MQTNERKESFVCYIAYTRKWLQWKRNLLCNDTARESHTQCMLSTTTWHKNCGWSWSINLSIAIVLGDIVTLSLLYRTIISRVQTKPWRIRNAYLQVTRHIWLIAIGWPWKYPNNLRRRSGSCTRPFPVKSLGTISCMLAHPRDGGISSYQPHLPFIFDGMIGTDTADMREYLYPHVEKLDTR